MTLKYVDFCKSNIFKCTNRKFFYRNSIMHPFLHEKKKSLRKPILNPSFAFGCDFRVIT